MGVTLARLVLAKGYAVVGTSRDWRTASLANLTRLDWEWAPEHVEAMWPMLQRERPEDFVIAIGSSHSLEHLVESAFAAGKSEHGGCVHGTRPASRATLCGRASTHVLGVPAR